MELAPISISWQLLGVIEFLWLHFSPKKGYKVQIDVFVLQKYKNTLKIFDF